LLLLALQPPASFGEWVVLRIDMRKLRLALAVLILGLAVSAGSYRLLRAQLAGTSTSNGSGAPSGACTSGSTYTDSSTGFAWTCKAGAWQLGATIGVMSGTTGSIGGGALLVGASASGTATVTGATTGMACIAQASDGTNMAAVGATVSCTVTAANTATVNVAAIIALTPASKTYSVRVVP
jgi:hypothetical protein